MKTIQDIKSKYEQSEVVDEYNLYTNEIKLWKSEEIMLKKYFKKSDKILDIGCGAGRTTFNMYYKGYKNIVGIDLSKKMIDLCNEINNKNEYNIKFEQANVLDLHFRENEFEGSLFSFNGFSCIPTKEYRINALREINRVMKKESYFILIVLDRHTKDGKYDEFWENEKKVWELGKNDGDLFEYGDINTKLGFYHCFTSNEIKEIAMLSGFEIVEEIWQSDLCKEYDRVAKYFPQDHKIYVLKN